MRQLLVTIILFYSICDPASLLTEFYNFFTNDIQYKIQKMVQLPTYIIPEQHFKNHVLVELENLFIKNGACMTDYGLPKPDLNLCNKVKIGCWLRKCHMTLPNFCLRITLYLAN
jgi:hypothetical protein